MSTRKSLREAAVDVLQASAKQNQEPIHKGPVVPSGEAPPAQSAGVEDLGGASVVKPEGTAIGKKESELANQMAAPKGPATAGDKAIKSSGTNTDGGAPAALAHPPMATQSGEAPKPAGTEEAEDVIENAVPTAEEIEAARQERLASIRATMASVSVDEDMAAMFGGQQLSEEFMAKAKTVFEAAVVARAVTVVEQMEKEIISASEAAVSEIKQELENTIDGYLDHMVEQWMAKNEVAIVSGLRTEIVEDFIGGLRALFVENNMDIPEEQVSVVEQLTAKVEELQGKLDETLNNNIALSSAINSGKKAKVLATACEGLVATQAEKLKTLAEGVEFTTEGEYAEKLKIIREQYFSTTTKTGEGKKPAGMIVENNEPVQVEQVVSGEMAAYVGAITKLVKS